MAQQKPDISIVTPSYNMLEFLPRCVASVNDQGVQSEHIVMDGGSTDGTAEWLATQSHLVWTSGKDGGMYNALNAGIARAQADIIGHLNCDEQYLPGILSFVVEYFRTHPDVDLLASDFLVTDKNGDLIAYRKSFKPIWWFFFSNYLYTTTCTLFYRKHVFAKCTFDASYRSIADVIFVADVLRNGFKAAHVKRYAAVFALTGKNLSLDPVSNREKLQFNKTLPVWYRILKPFFFLSFFFFKVINGNYAERSNFSYEIYTDQSLTSRAKKTIQRPKFRLIYQNHHA